MVIPFLRQKRFPLGFLWTKNFNFVEVNDGERGGEGGDRGARGPHPAEPEPEPVGACSRCRLRRRRLLRGPRLCFVTGIYRLDNRISFAKFCRPGVRHFPRGRVLFIYGTAVKAGWGDLRKRCAAPWDGRRARNLPVRRCRRGPSWGVACDR